jgi:hypothetical protein
LYWLRVDKLGVSHRTVPVAAASSTSAGGASTSAVGTAAAGSAALRALLAGTDGTEKTAGLHSTIPTGSRLLGLTLVGGVATANFDSTYASGGGSLSVTGRLAQVVYTLTQFPTVKSVRFELDGKVVKVFGGEGLVITHPLTRLDPALIDVVPFILQESPAVGDSLHSPLHVSGMSNTYEATYRVQLVDSAGRMVVNSFGTATAGTGTWGTFSASFPFTTRASGTGTLRVFEESAKNGAPIHEVTLHLPIR